MTAAQNADWHHEKRPFMISRLRGACRSVSQIIWAKVKNRFYSKELLTINQISIDKILSFSMFIFF